MPGDRREGDYSVNGININDIPHLSLNEMEKYLRQGLKTKKTTSKKELKIIIPLGEGDIKDWDKVIPQIIAILKQHGKEDIDCIIQYSKTRETTSSKDLASLEYITRDSEYP